MHDKSSLRMLFLALWSVHHFNSLDMHDKSSLCMLFLALWSVHHFNSLHMHDKSSLRMLFLALWSVHHFNLFHMHGNSSFHFLALWHVHRFSLFTCVTRAACTHCFLVAELQLPTYSVCKMRVVCTPLSQHYDLYIISHAWQKQSVQTVSWHYGLCTISTYSPSMKRTICTTHLHALWTPTFLLTLSAWQERSVLSVSIHNKWMNKNYVWCI